MIPETIRDPYRCRSGKSGLGRRGLLQDHPSLNA